ncbi:hypothetical protein EDD85DRAFT_67073 [Armillaria nabsnona]|nr:hypothetical protein EDD85DRAFT_67073 [Armillaria nabsnona]
MATSATRMKEHLLHLRLLLILEFLRSMISMVAALSLFSLRSQGRLDSMRLGIMEGCLAHTCHECVLQESTSTGVLHGTDSQLVGLGLVFIAHSFFIDICFKVCKKRYMYDVENPSELTPNRIAPQNKQSHLTQSNTGFVQHIQERTRR